MLNRWTFPVVTLLICCLTFERVSTWLIRSGQPVHQRSEFPFIALLTTGQSMCTGSLVSTRAVLTASHCVCTSLPVSKVAFLTLRIGDPKGVHYKPSGVKVAPEYMPFCEMARKGKPAKTAIGGADIAVIVLSQSVNLRVGIKVLSLPQPTDIPTPGTAVLIVGYGMDSNDRDPRRKVGGILKKGRATVIECKYPTGGNPICVKASQNMGQLAAPGDSGGPLLPSPQGPIIGVVSQGVTLPNHPDVIVEYASVARWVEFVRSSI
ncbi:unnamed protein product [Schistosoma margrebowiei]|uniref:Uncharacterized protein n=1 Tax=Schistosoma margrebowiei TaxID=48269 RepID=A0A183MR88_9TREM|nr:unnamed protein product [Schistosoma margrebowiei]